MKNEPDDRQNQGTYSISTSNVDVNRIPLPPGGEGSGEGGISNESGQWQFTHPPPLPSREGAFFTIWNP